jgi:hypothetical protein
MGSRLQVIDKRVSPSPGAYELPSKMVEKQGKTFGIKIKDVVTTDKLAPGPGQYSQDKLKTDYF